MVCGSIGYGGIEKIRRLYAALTEKGFDAINHLLEKDMDYSHIYDFRDKLKLSQVIVEHDLECIDNADVLVVIINSPSYGTAMEMLIAKGKGKKIVSLAMDSVPTPWPIYFSDFIVRDEQELFRLLNRIRQQNQ
jgi:nucleoside 2-deoxyribosyltransferase